LYLQANEAEQVVNNSSQELNSKVVLIVRKSHANLKRNQISPYVGGVPVVLMGDVRLPTVVGVLSQHTATSFWGLDILGFRYLAA
jgi:hypothetical protein